MKVAGPKPLDSENAETAYGRVFFYLQKIIAADLKMASTDDRLDRAVMGAVVATRVLLDAFENIFSRSCHKQDFLDWKLEYLEWFDRNSRRLLRTSSERKEMRRLAETEFDLIIDQAAAAYRLSDKLKMSDDKTADLRYFGKDGHLVKIPPLT